MMTFKEQIKNDISAVFHNPEEHADVVSVRYNRRQYEIPVVINHDGARDRKKPSADNADGIFAADLTVYMSSYDLGIMPRKNTSIEIGGDIFNIVRAGCDAGEIKLELERLDE